MKKHQFVKSDCNCARRATYFKCKYCGTVEYCSRREVESLETHRAACTESAAPDVSPGEKFRGMMGGSFNCLSPDFETWERDEREAAARRGTR